MGKDYKDLFIDFVERLKADAKDLYMKSTEGKITMDDVPVIFSSYISC